MSKQIKKHFIEECDLMKSWEDWKNTNPSPEERVISNKFALQILEVSSHLLNHPNFVRYQQWMKDEMSQDGYLKCQKNLKNYDPAKGTLFNYLTTCCWCAFVTYLQKHYKEMNLKRQMIMKALESANNELGMNTPEGKKISEQIKKQLEELNNYINNKQSSEENEQ